MKPSSLEFRLRHRRRLLAQFARHGFVHLPAMIPIEEINGARRSFDRLVTESTTRHDPDAHFVIGERTGTQRFTYLSHILDKSTMMRILLGHPALTNIVSLLIGSANIATSEFLVLKEAEDPWHVGWHRVANSSSQVPEPGNAVLLGISLDLTDETNCVWVVPGSQRWHDERVRRRIQEERLYDATPLITQAGDIVASDVRLLHASPAQPKSCPRRTVYFEFRSVALVRARGPYREEYVDRKLTIMAACQAERSGLPFERPATYRLTSGEYYRERSSA